MTTTGPLPAVRISSAEDRLALLDRMGARAEDHFTRYHFPTADAVVDPARGCLYIACDIDVNPADWAAVCGLIQAVGFADDSLPHRKDPGEPDIDPLTGICVWRLEYADPCIWCDSKGTSDGCPLCQRTC
jgi:hypothetical protein